MPIPCSQTQPLLPYPTLVAKPSPLQLYLSWSQTQPMCSYPTLVTKPCGKPSPFSHSKPWDPSPHRQTLLLTLIKKKIMYIQREWSSCKVIYGLRKGFQYMRKCANISPYMRRKLLHSEFPHIWGKFSFLFYQCILQASILISWSLGLHSLNSSLAWHLETGKVFKINAKNKVF